MVFVHCHGGHVSLLVRCVFIVMAVMSPYLCGVCSLPWRSCLLTYVVCVRCHGGHVSLPVWCVFIAMAVMSPYL